MKRSGAMTTNEWPRDYFSDTLQADFGDKAEEQLDIAINWGRHAELFAYDDDTGELYLESHDGKNG